ncbi:MAG: hypothetical protein AAGJ97_13645 [Planctomycetota bacterium]
MTAMEPTSRLFALGLIAAAGLFGTAAEAKTGRIYFENRSPDTVEIDIIYYVDAAGKNRGLSGTVEFDPGEKSLITWRDEPIYASKVRFTCKSKFGTTTWTSAPNNFDDDGDLVIYHAREVRPLVYDNRTGVPVTLKGNSYVDDRGLEVKGPWTWEFAAGERSKLLIDGELVKASRFDYTVIYKDKSARWFARFEDEVNDELVAFAGYVNRNSRTTAYGPDGGEVRKPRDMPAMDLNRRREKIKF